MSYSPRPTEHKTLQILRRSYLCGLSRNSERLLILVQELEDLTPSQKYRLMNRYTEIVENIHKRTLIYAILFHGGRAIVTIGSLIVPALLSIQYTGSPTPVVQTINMSIYWATWVISLLVTMCNGILTLFKVDKKYYFLHTTLAQFQSELWQYIHLTGKYGGYYTKGRVATHTNQYIYFSHMIEKIKLRQVEEEYYKLTDASSSDKQSPIDLSGNKPIPKPQPNIAGIFNPTPDQDTLLRHQQEIAKAILNPTYISKSSQKSSIKSFSETPPPTPPETPRTSPPETPRTSPPETPPASPTNYSHSIENIIVQIDGAANDTSKGSATNTKDERRQTSPTS